MTKKEIIYEYEQMLLGKKKNIDSEIFCFNEYGNEKLALEIFRYAIEDIMHWSPIDAYHGLNEKYINLLKLKHIVRYIRFPAEFDSDKDFYFIVSRLYPDKIKINVKERTLIMYQQLLSGEIKKFPKRFLEGRDGEMRAAFCLKYAIQNYGLFENIEDLYRAFSCSEGNEFLRKVKLYLPCTTLYELPIDFLHASFPQKEQEKNEFIYTMYRFRAYEKMLIKKKNSANRVRNKNDETPNETESVE